MSEEGRTLSIGQALDLGCEMAMAGNHVSAMGLFRGVLTHEPNNFEAVERLGSSLFEMGRYHEALYWFWRGRKINRRHALSLTNYGLCLSQIGHPDEALPDLERATHFAEKNEASPAVQALVWNNFGNSLERLGRHPEALAALDKGIACNPLDPFPHYNRGIALLRLNRQREAIEALDLSLTLQAPGKDSTSRLNHADARYNRGMARLLLGDIKGGLADYEYRLLTSENKVPNLGLPAEKKWLGEPIVGRTILVHCEQGLGDDIQFFRFLPLLIERGAKVLVMAHRATAPLLSSLPLTVLMPGSPLPDYDVWVALMSLPLWLGEATIPPPWLPPIAPAADYGAARAARLRVGVCWAGNFQHKNDAHRSIALDTFAALFEAPCDFVSLQQLRDGETEPFAALQLRYANLTAVKAESFRTTAAAIVNLDLVISVDTAVAHLAGSLGIETWILLPAFGTDWRWQLERTDSPWYPSARLWRQPEVGYWAPVLKDIRDELSMSALTRAA